MSSNQGILVPMYPGIIVRVCPSFCFLWAGFQWLIVKLSRTVPVKSAWMVPYINGERYVQQPMFTCEIIGQQDQQEISESVLRKKWKVGQQYELSGSLVAHLFIMARIKCGCPISISVHPRVGIHPWLASSSRMLK